jgi:hypothetical protein
MSSPRPGQLSAEKMGLIVEQGVLDNKFCFRRAAYHFEIGGCVAAATHSGAAAPLPPN